MYFAVDKDGMEVASKEIPSRQNDEWVFESDQYKNMQPGTIEMLTGYCMTWENEPIEIEINIKKA